MTIAIESLTGHAIAAAIPDLARLRIAVFAEWPYLYDGDIAYEEEYLREFAQAPDAVLVVARDGSRTVGAATASPMMAQKEEFRTPLEARGIDTESLFYFGESVLLPGYRGQGIGHAFFDRREAQAMGCGSKAACFAAVIRPADHPDRPEGYRPLDGFWRKRGYTPVEGIVTELAWKDRCEAVESPKQMQFWLREFDA